MINHKGGDMRKVIIEIIILCMAVLGLLYICIRYSNTQMVKELCNQSPIVFSARLNDGVKGTFKYNIDTKQIEKISDWVFHELSYSEDKKKIIGVIWEDEFQGLAEFDIQENMFLSIIDLKDLNQCAQELGLDQAIYGGPGVTKVHIPRYYREGYTFFWNDSAHDICYLKKEKSRWNMQVINHSNFQGYTYFVKWQGEEDTLFLESREKFLSQKVGRGTIIEKNIRSGETKALLDINLTEAVDSDGLMDMSDDMNKIVYYDNTEIYTYNVQTKQKEHIINQYLFLQYVLDLRFSPDGKYLFYTVGDIPFFWDGGYRLQFFVVDLEKKIKIKLNKWEFGDVFYGFDW